ncbi:MAG: hypothetical protein F6K14_11395 [Symploca sp. SIO2C1]|nr:hypothetical protein [Symploca sp. SIO2C1]
MTSKPVYLINKDAGYRLDSVRKPAEHLVCITMPSLARKTQQWLINDDRLITTVDGSQALTFQAPNKLILQPPRNNDNSQKWLISKQGVLQCELNKYSLQSEEDNIFDLSLPPDFSDGVVCQTPFKPSAPFENEKWTVEYVDGSGSANDLLEPIKDYRTKIVKRDALPKGENYGSRFDFNPATYFGTGGQNRTYKEPRIAAIFMGRSSWTAPQSVRVSWANLADDTPYQRHRMIDLLRQQSHESDSTLPPIRPGRSRSDVSYQYLRDYQECRSSSYRQSAIHLQRYLTKVTGIWCCIEANHPSYGFVRFRGFTSLTFEANDGNFLVSPRLLFVHSMYNLCPYALDYNYYYYHTGAEQNLAVGKQVIFPNHFFQQRGGSSQNFKGTLKEKKIVTLEASSGYEIVGFHGYSDNLLRSRKSYFSMISQLGIYERPVSKNVEIARYL